MIQIMVRDSYRQGGNRESFPLLILHSNSEMMLMVLSNKSSLLNYFHLFQSFAPIFVYPAIYSPYSFCLEGKKEKHFFSVEFPNSV